MPFRIIFSFGIVRCFLYDACASAQLLHVYASGGDFSRDFGRAQKWGDDETERRLFFTALGHVPRG